jgi:hypothetical protein
MALFDTSGGLSGLLGDFGFGVPRNTGGLIGDEDRDAINKRALLSGGINAALTYLATPKNLNVGSALPYLGKAGLAGFNASQNTVDQALNNVYRQKLLAGKEDNIRTYEKDRQKITEQFDPITKKWTPLGISSLDAPKEDKKRQYTGTFENVAINMFPLIDPADLNESQRKQVLKAAERYAAAGALVNLPLRQQEADYNMPPPKLNTTTNPLIIDSTSVKAPNGLTYKFNTIEEANAFRQQTGSK